MKVLLCSHGAGPYGAERLLISLAQGLATRGHRVVLDFPHEGPAVEAAGSLRGVDIRLTERPRLPRNLAEGVRFFWGIPNSITNLYRLVRDVEPDVTWVNSLFNPWAALGARAAGSPVIWQLHERNPSPPLGFLAAAGMGMTARRIVVISEYVAQSLGSYPWLPCRIRRVSNPLLEPLTPTGGEPDGPFTVGYVGQMEPRKRVPDLVRAVARLAGVRAVLVGDGKARGAVERAIGEEGVHDRVELLGYREDAPAEFGRFHCIAIPSLREPFGLVALEAMARGIPVVAAESGALPEVLGPAALFHAPGDPDSLAMKIRALKEDPVLRRTLRDAGFKRVSDFGREKWLDTVEEVLLDAVRRGKLEE